MSGYCRRLPGGPIRLVLDTVFLDAAGFPRSPAAVVQAAEDASASLLLNKNEWILVAGGCALDISSFFDAFVCLDIYKFIYSGFGVNDLYAIFLE